MTAGFRVLNKNGVLQIDENYQNFQLKQKKSISLTAFEVGQLKTLTFDGSPSAIVAVRSTVGFVAVARTSYSGSTWTYDFRCLSSSATAITVYVFDVGVPQAETLGLAVWDEDGKLVFHSSGKSLRVTSFDSAKTCAVVQNGLGIREYRNVDYDYSAVMINGLRVGAAGVESSLFLLSTKPGYNNLNADGSWTVVDVTHY